MNLLHLHKYLTIFAVKMSLDGAFFRYFLRKSLVV